jgi:subtilisin family serine protease
MKSSVILAFVAVLVAVAPLVAGPPDLRTVIVTPVESPSDPGRTGATRVDLVSKLMDEATRSQAHLVAELQTLAGQRGPTTVSEVHPLWIVNRVIVTATPETIDRITRRPDVAAVQPAQVVRLVRPVDSGGPAADAGAAEYGIVKVRAPEVWSQHGFDGKGVLVGHLDTGADSRHPELKGKIAAFKDFFSAASESLDGQGHGTHTAGTIAGGALSGKAIGVAPGVRLIVGRIFNNSGETTDAVILKAMNWIADPDGNPGTADAPRLVSCSWGGDKTNDTPGDPLWKAAQHWVDLDILPVFAAGNSGPGPRTVGAPAAFPHCLAIGATNQDDGIAGFSSRGPVKWDGVDHITPDVCAPGSRTVSAKDGGGYTTHSGTSMACPHAAGVVALVLQANPSLKPKQIVDILRSTASKIGGAEPGNTFGWGRIDALKAVEKARALALFTRAGE